MFKTAEDYANTISEMKSKISVTEIERLILSQLDSDTIDLGWHIDRWAHTKAPMYRMFGNQFKIEAEVDNNVTDSEYKNELEIFDKSYLTCEPRAVLFLYFILNLVNKEEVLKNELSRDVIFYGVKFQNGMKLSRIISKLVPSDLVDGIQTGYSIFLQKFNGKGRAVVSIHPLDYLTMSENSSGWRSCHALDGEYRAGTLAYMIDESSAIAYVSSSNYEKTYGVYEDGKRVVKRILVDNKSWRQVVLFKVPRFESDNFVPFAVQSRQYPATINAYSNPISNLIAEYMSKYINDTFKVEKKVAVGILQSFQDNEENAVWYNDIYHSSFEYGRVVYQRDKYNDISEVIRDRNLVPALVGMGDIQCVCGCGSQIQDGETFYGWSHHEDDYWDEDED